MQTPRPNFIPSAPQRLEYSPKRWRIPRSIVGWLIVFFVVLIGLPLTVRIEREGNRRTQIHQLFQTCLVYKSPPIAYSENESDRARLGGTVGYRSTADLRNPGVYFLPPTWETLSTLCGELVNSSGKLFLHERHAAGGDARLVSIDIAAIRRTGPLVAELSARCDAAGARLGLPSRTYNDVASVQLAAHDGELKILCGLPDARDASHFTIDYTVDNQPGTIDGWLKKDDSVLLEPRRSAPQ